MRIARVIGTVTLSKSHPAMDGCRLRCVEAVDKPDQIGNEPFGTETQVAWDLMNAGEGQLVALA
ncbi:MAG: EutN/CcmL family microcompartment protein, partial [Planctomycetota bacterium]